MGWKKIFGTSRIRQKVARATGVPTTREGRKRKFGGGCAVFFLAIGLGLAIAVLIATVA